MKLTYRTTADDLVRTLRRLHFDALEGASRTAARDDRKQIVKRRRDVGNADAGRDGDRP